jgi:hypothetical protein
VLGLAMSKALPVIERLSRRGRRTAQVAGRDDTVQLTIDGVC